MSCAGLDWTGLVTSTAGAQLDFKAHEEHYVNADDDNRIFALPLLSHLWTDAASFWLSRRGRCRRPDNYRVDSATCWGFMDITTKQMKSRGSKKMAEAKKKNPTKQQKKKIK